MSKIISFFVRYKIWTNVLMASIFGFGLIFFGMIAVAGLLWAGSAAQAGGC